MPLANGDIGGVNSDEDMTNTNEEEPGRRLMAAARRGNSRTSKDI